MSFRSNTPSSYLSNQSNWWERSKGCSDYGCCCHCLANIYDKNKTSKKKIVIRSYEIEQINKLSLFGVVKLLEKIMNVWKDIKMDLKIDDTKIVE